MQFTRLPTETVDNIFYQKSITDFFTKKNPQHYRGEILRSKRMLDSIFDEAQIDPGFWRDKILQSVQSNYSDFVTQKNAGATVVRVPLN